MTTGPKQHSHSLKSVSVLIQERIEVLGSLDACVLYKQQQAQVQFLVVTGSGPNLLGRNWLHSLKLDWREIHYLRDNSVDQLLEKHSQLFRTDLGMLQGHKVSIHVDPIAKPFCKARSLTYAYLHM